ncbi:hypothetical protein ACLMJK_008326 [Lecanora helva]
MDAPMNPLLLHSDKIVLENLLRDARVQKKSTNEDDQSAMRALDELHDETTVFTNWDLQQLPSGQGIRARILNKYICWAQGIMRNPVDVVFLTHIILYLSTSVPSAVFLYCHFTWIHAVMHVVLQLSYCGSFTLMLHNHIHNNGLLKKQYAWFDNLWPYILEPLMGHTWDSYYYHHVKHHHVEGNGPEDLSSTIRYQRDEVTEFLKYVGRFIAFIWIELPLYFVKKRKPGLAVKSFLSELTAMLFIYVLARANFCPTLFVLIIPFFLMRIGLMVGNYGQHALVDDVDPASDFRSSITLIDVPSNRHCFNDGWHTSHHLNPLRHWKDHPRAFLKSKQEYTNGRALVFQNIDYLMMTYRILRKDYLYLADCIVPIGDQIGMSKQQIADMLQTKTRKFSEAEIQEKYYKGEKAPKQARRKDELYISKI